MRRFGRRVAGPQRRRAAQVAASACTTLPTLLAFEQAAGLLVGEGIRQGMLGRVQGRQHRLQAAVLLDKGQGARGADALDRAAIVAAAQDADVHKLVGRQAQLGQDLQREGGMGNGVGKAGHLRKAGTPTPRPSMPPTSPHQPILSPCRNRTLGRAAWPRRAP